MTGGQIALTSDVENYPGIDAINGFDLSQAMHKQAEKYGMETAYADVTAIDQVDGMHVVRTERGRLPGEGRDHHRWRRLQPARRSRRGATDRLRRLLLRDV